jgi:hypothetical protein
MLKLLSLIGVFVLLAVASGASVENKTWKNEILSPNATHAVNSSANAAQCYDARIANFINTGLQYYAHDMGE